MNYRFLKVIFIIFLLVIIGEGGYYFYILQTNSPKIVPSKNREEIITLNLNSKDPLLSAENLEYVKSDFIPYLTSLKKNENINVYLVTVYTGYVEEISFDAIRKILNIQVFDKNKNLLVKYGIREMYIPYKKFYKMIEGVKIPITYKEVKEGDSIKAISYTDLVDSSKSYIEFLVNPE